MGILKSAVPAILLLAVVAVEAHAEKPSVRLSLEMPQIHSAWPSGRQLGYRSEPVSQTSWSNADYVDPGAATVIALIPGFFVHGAGHLYARDYLRGTILLGVQTFSAFWFFKETFAGMIEGDEEGSATGQIAAISLYFGSWFYDVFRAGAAAEKYNGRVHLAIQSEGKGIRVVASVNF